ncbi:MAG: TonB-dependent receptor [Methyloversatilis discipulorum]|uniref:TonB-dependent receptor family protein n=1 Tax=Methyloversatilis discipulorum TaxID=1119528 RepID=UPI0026EEA6A0|nr:TonB-dependent receptor [Methyloversatilis discipulorum]MBT9517413.1 TonB-dependent receptor [Methyloversatilis discipulorum]
MFPSSHATAPARARLKRIPLALAALAAAPAVFADSALQLPAVRVEARRIDAATLPGIDEARAALALTPGGAAVIDSASFRDARVSTLQDALGYSAGVFVQPRFGSEESRLSIRGSGLQRTFHLRGIKLMQDGVPINLADGGGDFQVLEPLATRYIEVWRGANALQYGSSTLGGAINYVSPTGHDAPALTVRAETGAFGYLRSQLAGGFAAGRVDGYFSATSFAQDGFRDHARQDTQRVVGNLGVLLAPSLETRFFVQAAQSDSELPGNLTRQQLRDNPRQAAAGNVTGNQKRDIDLWRVSNRTVWQAADGLRFELSAYYADKDLFHPIFQVLDQRSKDFGAELRMVSDGTLAGRPNRLVAGLASSRGDTDDDRWTNIGGTRGARANKFDTSARNVEAYVEDQFTFVPGWTAVVGTQYTNARRRSRDLCFTGGPLVCGGADESFSRSYEGWSPKFGIRHDLSPAVQLFGNVSRSFEPPSFGELTGGAAVIDSLRAQRATTWEVGGRGSFGWGAVDLALYRAKVTDELLGVAVNTITGQTTTINVPKTVHRGVEFAAHGQFGGGFEWRQALLYNDFRFDGDALFGDNRLPGVPRTLFRGELGYRFAGAPGGPLKIAASAEWSPQRYAVDMANTEFADDYAIFGLRMQQQLGRQLSWFIEGRNLGDRRYAATTNVVRDFSALAAAARNVYLPGDGRAVYAGIEWRM